MKRYNLLVLFMVALIICIPLFSIDDNSEIVSDGFSELPQVEADVSQPEDETVVVPKFKDTEAAKLYAYAYKLCYQGKGYSSKTIQYVSAETMGTKFAQKCYIDRSWNANGEGKEETTSSGSIHFYDCDYTDGTTVYGLYKDGEYNYGEPPTGTAKVYTKEAWVDYRGNMPGTYLHKIDKTTARFSNISKNGNVLSFRVTLTSPEAYEGYLKSVNIMSGSATYPVVNSIYIDFEINAKTGCFIKSTKYEEYNVTKFGLNVDCKSTSYEVFYAVNKNVTITATNLNK